MAAKVDRLKVQPRPNEPKRTFIQGPITSFPEDVGWRTMERVPFQVHARKMGVAFEVDTPNGLRTGEPGDWLIVFPNGSILSIADPASFTESYREPAPPTPPAPPPQAAAVAPVVPPLPAGVTETERAKVEAALKALIDQSATTVKDYAKDFVTKARAVKDALDASPTIPPKYACPFCSQTWDSREPVKAHIMNEHIAKALFGSGP
jgi:hypothetical protein